MQGRVGCWLATAAFAMDRVTKLWAVSRLRGSPPVGVINGMLRFVYVENTGASFGIWGEQRVLLLLVTGVAILGLLLFLLTRGRARSSFVRVTLWLLLGGALGNFVDRLFLGYVIDFIEIILFSFPVFNIADCCLCISFGLLAGWILLDRETKPNAA